MSKQRAVKLQEINAHTVSVNSVRLGRKSGRVLVTGGEDRKVNVWTIGKGVPVMSLTGHTSGVDSVAFDPLEEVVVAGSSGGTLKLWDLSQKKVVRTLNGHKASCSAVEYHPCGEFFASGSHDTDLKIWDVRRKGCIQTYKGHHKAINVVRFSPDGRWVVSGGEDGKINAWDLTAGRLLRELPHSWPVTSLDFHPNEFLLASGGKDGVVNFWDLEVFENVSKCAPELGVEASDQGVFSLVFTNDGKTLLSGYHKCLKAWGWEPTKCRENLPTDWTGLCDMIIKNDQLIACAKDGTSVTMWAMNLTRVLEQSSTPLSVHLLGHNSLLSPYPAGIRFIPKENYERVDFPNTEQFNEPVQISPPNSAPAPAPIPAPAAPITANSGFVPDPINIPSITPTVSPAPVPIRQQINSAPPKASTKKPTNNRHTPQQYNQDDEDFVVDTPPQQYNTYNKQQLTPTEGPTMEPFRLPADAAPLQVFTELVEPHDSILSTLSSRLTLLKDIRAVWSTRGGDSKAALEAINTIKSVDNNTAVMVDFLSVISLREDVFTLDFAVAVLDTLTELLSAAVEGHVIIALSLLLKLVKNFGPVIRATRESPPPKGVDLSYEERLQKCEYCYRSLSYIRDALLVGMVRRPGRVGVHSRELANMLKSYITDDDVIIAGGVKMRKQANARNKS